MVYARYLVERINADMDPIDLLLRTRQVLLAAGFTTTSVRLS